MRSNEYLAALPRDRGDLGRQGFHLFLIGFLVLFLELACIRWFAAYVVFLQFFTNVILIGSFLGMSCGCLTARRRQEWLRYFPLIAVGAVFTALLTYAAYAHWRGLVVNVGGQASPQEVFFGTGYRSPDAAKFVVPIEAIAAVFFMLVALMFVGLGQALGRAFDAYPNRVRGYALNIGGSLAGITAFSLLSYFETTPALWFLIACAGIAYLLHQRHALTPVLTLSLAVLVIAIALPTFNRLHPTTQTRWSPYYKVSLNTRTGDINVDEIAHQQMVPFASRGALYSLIHLLEKHSGGKPFRNVLVIGAGSGNDVAHALRFGAKRIDAVEIDPVIQNIGIHDHPDHPYEDPRVVAHLDDGRHFLRTTNRKYDLVVYGLVDSLVLHSSYANIRLESYLFTPQAFADVRRVLKPGGVFVMYNYLRQGWIVERLAAMVKKTFGRPPIILSLPYTKTLKSADPAGFTMIIAGHDRRIAAAFARYKTFWLNAHPPRNLTADGFAVNPAAMPQSARKQWLKISPTTLIHDGGPVLSTSDNWPFLYLRGRLIPNFTIRSIALLALLGIGMVYLFLPKRRLSLHPRMFFLGAGFMLLETRAVVQMALLFGSTWIVNSAVFFTALLLILLANIYFLKMPKIHLGRHYLGLLAFLTVAVLVPADTFLGGGILWRYAAPCALALGPMFFAGVIFARTFHDAENPDHAFGANIAGSVVGGLAEPLSMVLGFQHLLFLAMAFYLLSGWPSGLRQTAPRLGTA